MRIALITGSISPHQLPFSKILAKYVGPENFRYICEEASTKGRSSLGWQLQDIPEWVIITNSCKTAKKEAYNWKVNSDVIISGERDFSLYKKRASAGKLSFYMSERWFKPPWGTFRLISPKYFLMALSIMNLMKSDKFYYLPIGVHAATDMFRLFRLFSRKFEYLENPIEFEPITKPFSDLREVKNKILQYNPQKYQQSSNDVVFKNIKLWGYFVDKSSIKKILDHSENNSKKLKIIWVGRLLALKRIDTLIKAVKSLTEAGIDIELTIIGRGPQERKLKRLAFKTDTMATNIRTGEANIKNTITFLPPVSIIDIRKFMRMSDIYILPSNSYEGWGAVVNEAMEEGCAIIATRESGAGVTMIEHGINGLLFSSGNVEELKKCIITCYTDRLCLERLKKEALVTINNVWGVEQGAQKIMSLINTLLINKQDT